MTGVALYLNRRLLPFTALNSWTDFALDFVMEIAASDPRFRRCNASCRWSPPRGVRVRKTEAVYDSSAVPSTN